MLSVRYRANIFLSLLLASRPSLCRRSAMLAGTVRVQSDSSQFSGVTDLVLPPVALATSWINAGQALRRAQDIGLHVRVNCRCPREPSPRLLIMSPVFRDRPGDFNSVRSRRKSEGESGGAYTGSIAFCRWPSEGQVEQTTMTATSNCVSSNPHH